MLNVPVHLSFAKVLAVLFVCLTIGQISNKAFDTIEKIWMSECPAPLRVQDYYTPEEGDTP